MSVQPWLQEQQWLEQQLQEVLGEEVVKEVLEEEPTEEEEELWLVAPHPPLEQQTVR